MGTIIDDDEEDVVSNQPETAQHLDGGVLRSCNRSEARFDEGVLTRMAPSFCRTLDSATACWCRLIQPAKTRRRNCR